jgi:hypothetical protein
MSGVALASSSEHGSSIPSIQLHSRPILLAESAPTHVHARSVEFLHPGYPEPSNVLMRLPALDGAGSSLGGIHLYTAFISCAIVAGNAFTGSYLTAETRDGVSIDFSPQNFDIVLNARKYYFHVESFPGLVDTAPRTES